MKNTNKGIVLGLLSVWLVQAPCFAMVKQEQTYQADVKSLHAIAQRYTDFLAQFCKKETGDLMALMKSLFASDVKKVVNGKTVAKSSSELHAQVLEAKKDVGLWSVHIVGPFIASADRNTVVLHCEIPTEKQGTLVVMKFLVCDDQGRIKEINEVFNKKSE